MAEMRTEFFGASRSGRYAVRSMMTPRRAVAMMVPTKVRYQGMWNAVMPKKGVTDGDQGIQAA